MAVPVILLVFAAAAVAVATYVLGWAALVLAAGVAAGVVAFVVDFES